MDILKFMGTYGVEANCRKKYKEIRDEEGVVCKKCNSQEHYWLKSKEMYQCKKCNFRTSLRSGTIMESSKLPFHYWFVAIYLMSCMKKGTSARNVQRQLGHKRYEPIWAMMHKIRSAMGKRDNRYMLKHEIEIDEGFFETIVPKEQKEEIRKRGRGSQKQTMSMVFAQTEDAKNPKKKYKTKKRCKFFKMVVCEDFQAKTAKNIINLHLESNARMITDGYSTYQNLKKEFKNLEAEKTPANQAHIKLPWVHTAIGNAKKVLQGIHQHLKPEYLQNYLNEFCYKLNRRYFGNQLFNRTLVAMVDFSGK